MLLVSQGSHNKHIKRRTKTILIGNDHIFNSTLNKCRQSYSFNHVQIHPQLFTETHGEGHMIDAGLATNTSIHSTVNKRICGEVMNTAKNLPNKQLQL